MPVPLLLLIMLFVVVLSNPWFIIFAPMIWYAVGSFQGHLTGKGFPLTDGAGDLCRKIDANGTANLESGIKRNADAVKWIAKRKWN